MIYVGFQGIGKSYLAGKYGFIDLESSNFNYGDSKIDNWEFAYCNTAISLSNQGYDVFISSHQSVRDELRNGKIPFTAIFPSLKLKDEWVKKLEDRFKQTNLQKDYRAMINCLKYYEDEVSSLMNEERKIIIDNIGYVLYYLIRDVK